MKDAAQQKIAHGIDGGMVLGGAAYVSFADALPFIIGLLTAILFIIRIAVAIQEWRLNRRKLKQED